MAESNLIYPELVDRVINIPDETPAAIDNVLISGRVSLRNIPRPQIGMMSLGLTGSDEITLANILIDRQDVTLFEVNDVFSDDVAPIAGDGPQWFVNDTALVPAFDMDSGFIIGLIGARINGSYNSNSIELVTYCANVLDAGRLQTVDNWVMPMSFPFTVYVQ